MPIEKRMEGMDESQEFIEIAVCDGFVDDRGVMGGLCRGGSHSLPGCGRMSAVFNLKQEFLRILTNQAAYLGEKE